MKDKLAQETFQNERYILRKNGIFLPAAAAILIQEYSLQCTRFTVSRLIPTSSELWPIWVVLKIDEPRLSNQSSKSFLVQNCTPFSFGGKKKAPGKVRNSIVGSMLTIVSNFSDHWLDIAAWAIILLGVVSFVSAFFLTTPYGRYSRYQVWGFGVNARLAWLVQECPSFLIPFSMFLSCKHTTDGRAFSLLVWSPNTFLITLFMVHYFRRYYSINEGIVILGS